MSFRPGFDDRWISEEDFVLGITRDIWEDRCIHSLNRSYGPDLIVRSPASVVRGNAGIVAATQETLAEFPDRELLGEDVIWTEVDAASFLSSHRLLCTATHAGTGMYGPATGRRLTYRIIADCFCRENAVADEWLVRDQGAIVRQMGLDPKVWTRGLIDREGGPERCQEPFSPTTDLPGPYAGAGNDSPHGRRLADLVTGAMNGDFSVFEAGYDRAAGLAYWGHFHDHGPAAATKQWLGLRASFPSAIFTVHHAMGAETAAMPPRAALRWTFRGRHDGWGAFGAPSGADVTVFGMTHAEFGPSGLRREWSLIDETAIWKQILLHSG